MQNHGLDEAKRRLEKQLVSSDHNAFEQLRAQGLIDEAGRVTGHVHRWDADLAVIETKKPDARSKRIACFRCFKPVFGIPGGATIDIRRDSIVHDLSEGKKIITARWDDRLKLWMEGEQLRLSTKGGIRKDGSEGTDDDVGLLPEIAQTHTGL